MQDIEGSEYQRINAQYEAALSNPDNIRIISGVKKKFKNIPKDERDRCGLIALWKTLNKHEEGRQKFTSSLHRYTVWECKKWLRDNRPIRRKAPYVNEEKTTIVSDCIDLTPNGHLIREFYLNNKSEEELSQETGLSVEILRSELQSAVSKLKTLLEKNHAWELC